MQAGGLQLYYKSGSSTGVSPGSFQKFSRRPSLLAIFKQLLWKQKSTDLRSTEAGEYHPKMVRETEWFFHKAKAFWKYFLQNFLDLKRYPQQFSQNTISGYFHYFSSKLWLEDLQTRKTSENSQNTCLLESVFS